MFNRENRKRCPRHLLLLALAAPMVLHAQVPDLSHVWSYHNDEGRQYGKRDGGLTYGWTQSNTSTAQDKNSPLAVDERYDRSVDLGSGAGQAWEMEVPEGQYTVFVVAGAPEANDPHYRVMVEGTMVIDQSPAPVYPWVAGKGKVSVKDGKLTITGAPGARDNRICYVEVYQTPKEYSEKQYAKLPLKVNVGGGPAQGFMEDREWSENEPYGFTTPRYTAAPEGYLEPSDTFWVDKPNPFTTQEEITRDDIEGTTLDSVFGVNRTGEFGYKVRVHNGTYYLHLLFADLSRARQGRKFNVFVNGKDFAGEMVDVAAELGEKVAYEISGEITVSDELIEIVFEDLGAWADPMLNGLLVSGEPVEVLETGRVMAADGKPSVLIKSHNIEVRNVQPGDHVLLFTLSGKQIEKRLVQNSVDRMDVGRLSMGVYLLRCLREGQPVGSDRIVRLR